MRCGHCGGELVAGARFCPFCGAPADMGAGGTLSAQPGMTALADGAAAPLELPAGSVFHERYEIVRLLGRGGMGEVYLARDGVTGEEVCLKLVRPDLASDENAAKRFLREGLLSRALRHPNVVAVYDVARSDGRLYITMEFIEGVSLRAWLQGHLAQRRDVPLADACGIIRGVLDALAAAHRKGFIHRDVKPENIMLPGGEAEQAPRVKLLDFGIARALASQTLLSLPGSASGTPAYMAPEQETAGHAAGPGADLYSAGAVFYEMLAGVPPRGRWELPCEIRPDLPPAADEICRRALNPHPARRFQSAAEMADALASLVDGMHQTARSRERAARAPAPPDAGGGQPGGPAAGAITAKIRRLSAADTARLYIAFGRDEIQRAGLEHGHMVEIAVDGRATVRGVVKTSGDTPWLAPGGGWSNAAIDAALRAAGFIHMQNLPAQFRHVAEGSAASPKTAGSSPSPAPAAPADTPSSSGAPADQLAWIAKRGASLAHLGRNAQGFHEYALDQDPSVVLVFIPGGTFTMGSTDPDAYDDEKPLTKVTLSPYMLAKHPTTWGQYKKFCKATGYEVPETPSFKIDDSHPVVNVDWDDAVAYCEWAGLRLPTEAQWEFAARGPEGRKYPWGSMSLAKNKTLANFDNNVGGTTPAGNFPNGAGPFGTLDQAGNVWEWCANWYADKLPGGSVADPAGPASASDRVYRGGGWSSDARNLRGSFRRRIDPSVRDVVLGFRPAL